MRILADASSFPRLNRVKLCVERATLSVVSAVVPSCQEFASDFEGFVFDRSAHCLLYLENLKSGKPILRLLFKVAFEISWHFVRR